MNFPSNFVPEVGILSKKFVMGVGFLNEKFSGPRSAGGGGGLPVKVMPA